MQLSSLPSSAESALLVAVLRNFLIEEKREIIIPYLRGIRVTPLTLVLLLTSPLAQSEVGILLPKIAPLFKKLGYLQIIKTRLIQWGL